MDVSPVWVPSEADRRTVGTLVEMAFMTKTVQDLATAQNLIKLRADALSGLPEPVKTTEAPK